MNKKPWWAYWISVVIFLCFIVISQYTNVRDYTNDSVFIIVLLTVLMFMYHTFKLKPWIYLSMVFAYMLHNMGVFGFYNVSPVPIQWDHITHFVGIGVAAIIVYNYFKECGFLKGKKKKSEVFAILLIIFLAANGVGVLVEFIEFLGYVFVGDGLGIFGHGLGDVNTEWFNTEWFNTMFDLLYNSLGALVAIILLHFGIKKK